MNEAETRAELIDPKLKACGWGVVEGSKILRERDVCKITDGRIQTGGRRSNPLIADYILVYKGIKLAVVEAKSDELEVGEGVAQAKQYAEKLKLETTYSSNGKEIYSICMKTGEEALVTDYLSPDELWSKTYPKELGETAKHAEVWREKFANVPFEDKSGTWKLRYYQEIAVKNSLEAIANNEDRILLTLATGTGKTAIAFQIAWKLFQTRWNITRRPQSEAEVSVLSGVEVNRRPRILFLADRNILADQAFNSFSAFPEDALVRINPKEIKKRGSVPTNGSIFFTIFQSFMASTSSATKQDLVGIAAEPKTEYHRLPNTSIYKKEDIKKANAYKYILECADGSFYSGSTKNLSNRLNEHNEGQGSKHTKSRLPVKLVYYEIFDRIDEAFEREKQVQGWSKAKKIALIDNDIELLKSLSKSKKIEKVSEPVELNFGQYPKDYFDFIIIDECHRGGANDEGNWRGILEYFSPAFQLGLTATPKRKHNVDTYKYFGDPVYIYSLKEGINDGFLTPFKVKRIKTTLDDYIYTNDDFVVEGEIEEGKLYSEADFNKIIEIKAREAERVKIFMDEANGNEKTIIFCAIQKHAALVRDLVNQYHFKKNGSTNGASRSLSGAEVNYCVRVTANDGEIGEQFLREFQDNEKLLPTILTTSQKLSTGVDARNIRNIVLMRPVNQIIEFKQIVGRGTRLFEGKEFFTIYDFVDAYQRFSDPEWDGEPVEEEACAVCGEVPCVCEKTPPSPCAVCGERPCVCEKQPPLPCSKCGQRPCVCNKKVKVKLRDGKEREIKHMIGTSFWCADGKPVSAEEFLNNLFGELPNLFKSEDELRTLWSNPRTRKTLLEKLDEAGFGKEDLNTLKQLIDAEQSDLFDVLEYVFNSNIKPISREARVAAASPSIFAYLNEKQKDFVDFVLSKYIESGVEELAQEKLPFLLTNKYQSLEDAKEILGEVSSISSLFIEFQKHLYDKGVA
jgi:type I site-specific restriction endonuclease